MYYTNKNVNPIIMEQSMIKPIFSSHLIRPISCIIAINNLFLFIKTTFKNARRHSQPNSSQ